MLTKRCVNKIASAHGATYTWSEYKTAYGLHREVILDAPTGTVWAATYTHSLVCCIEDGGWEPVYADAIDRMSYGTAPCEDTDCDICHTDE